ncbi:MAG: hypothetical protein QG608_2562 [Actinomycetota bacterium]|nr:hypothetical protein [Actinomycetota bacterium]MDQ1294677.1 hypothetical protein [Actinomycetota bacterium]
MVEVGNLLVHVSNFHIRVVGMGEVESVGHLRGKAHNGEYFSLND